MRRLIRFCLIFSLMLSSMTVLAHENDYVGTKYEIPARVLETFQIISFDENGNLDLGSKISRAEFTVMVIKALHMDSYSAKTTADFSDVTQGTEIHNAVSIAKEIGLVSGYDDGTFRPNDTISIHQAANILCKMTGYELMAQSKGGYPHGYMQVAIDIGILDGVNNLSGELSKGDAILMIYSAMHADMVKPVDLGNPEEIQVEEGANIFSEYHKVYVTNGVMSDNGVTALDSQTRINKNEVMINGEVYKSDNALFNECLGYTVEIYYTDSEEDKEIVYGFVVEKKNEVFEIDAKNLELNKISLTDGYFSYYDEKYKVKKVSVAKDFDVIYNKIAFPSFVLEDFLIKSGTLKFIDNDTDGKMDVLFVEEYKHLIVSGVDEENKKIYSLNNEVLTIKNDAEYDFITADGENLNIGDLTSDMTISVFESRDKSYVTGIISTEMSNDTINAIANKDQIEIEIGDKTYKVSTAYKDFNANSLDLGESVLAYIDHKGEIAYLNQNQSKNDGYSYGYLIASYFDEDFEDDAVFRVFTQNGAFVNFNSAQYMTLNGEKTNGQNKKYTGNLVREALFAAGESRVKPQLIRYKLNSSNEIQKLETAVENTSPLGFDDENFSMDYSGNAVYRDIPKIFGSSYSINNNTIMFSIPNVRDGKIDEDGCKIINASSFEGNNIYPITLYDASSSRTAAVLVTPSFSGGGYSRWGLLVDYIETVVNDDGDVVTRINGYMSGKKAAYDFASEDVIVSSIKTGDLLRISLNAKGRIDAYSHLLKYDTEVFPSEMSSNPGGELVEVYGKVLSKESGAMTVMVKDNKVYAFVFFTYRKVYYVDRTDPNRISVGLAKSEDIIQSGNDYNDISIDTVVGSKVYINRRYDNAYDIVIIKD